MSGIALNFFPVTTEHFQITFYRLPYVEGSRPSVGEEQAIRRYLEIDGSAGHYWTLSKRIEGAVRTVCEPLDNTYATESALRLALLKSCRDNLTAEEFSLTEGFRPRIEITLAAFPEGIQVVSLEPYYLRSTRQFGFLAAFRFHPKEEHRRSHRALELSLSLDRHGQPNRNYYADRYAQLLNFVREFHPRIFPLTLPGGQNVDVGTHLVELNPSRLEVKRYIVGSNSESRSQFMGVKENGPLDQIANDTHLCFLYRPEDRPLSHDLFRALRGDTFRTFPGMEAMFHLSLRNDQVSGIPIAGFDYAAIERLADRVVSESNGSNVVPVVLTPFSRHDDLEHNSQYWALKHAFLARNLPLQVVATQTVADKNKLKWSTAGIGLQVFAKAGGVPWKVRPRTKQCLIVGIGQAHQISNHRVDRYFAYSVLTDSSGVFEEVRTLGESRDEEQYIQTFASNLRAIFTEYSDRFSNFVVHSTFAIRRNELETIANALSAQQQQWHEGDFVSIKFNDRNRFFGFAGGHNSRVPYESSMVRLSANEFLVWFEGLQYGQPNVSKRIGNPLHVQFTYPRDRLSVDKRRAHLQDAINLSGANWRGFNAKSLPVSVYYAQIIARYLKEFESHDLQPIDVNTLTPWFL